MLPQMHLICPYMESLVVVPNLGDLALEGGVQLPELCGISDKDLGTDREGLI